jgi:hypothetical protein
MLMPTKSVYKTRDIFPYLEFTYTFETSIDNNKVSMEILDATSPVSHIVSDYHIRLKIL